MRATVMRMCQGMLLSLLMAGTAAEVAAQQLPVRDIYMRSRWEFLPPILETEPNLSVYGGYDGNSGPGQQSASHIGVTQHLLLPDGVFSLTGEGFYTNSRTGGGTILGHTRQIIGGMLWGAGASYTVQNSIFDSIYEQGGVHVEFFPTEEWSIRASGYVPVGKRRRVVFDSGPVPQAPVFSGNNILVPTITRRTTEGAMGGIQIEVAQKLSNLAAEIFGGYFKYQAPAGRDAEGGNLGIRGKITRRLDGHFAVSTDNRFGPQAYGGVVWYFGGASGLDQKTLRDKLFLPVRRNKQIVMGRQTQNIPGSVLLTDGGAPITVAHVQDGAAGTNVGTFENPFNTNMLPATQPADILYLHGGGGPYLNGYTLAPGQRFLGEGGGNTHTVQTDQFGPITLPAGSGSAVRPAVQGTLTAANDAEISNVLFQPTGTAIALPMLNGDVNVNRSTIDGGVNGGTIGVDITGGSGTFTFGDVDILDTSVAALNIAGGSSDVIFGTFQPAPPLMADFPPGSIDQGGTGSVVTVSGGHTGSLLVNAGTTLSADSGTGMQFDNADGTYTFNDTVTLNGGDAGIDIVGGSDGTFTFADVDITSPTGTAVQVGSTGVAGSGGTADITLASLSSIVQASNAPAVSILGDHTGTFTMDGPITATNGTGLQFGEAATGANGTYDFGGIISLAGGDAGVDILGASSGSFTFDDLTVTSPTGTAFNIDGLGGTSTASVTWTSGNLNQVNNATAFRVVDHDTGMVAVDADVFTSDGDGMQFMNADGTYDFTGSIQMTGGDAGIDVIGGSDGVFSFNRPVISNAAGGIGVNIDGGAGQMAQVTLNGGSITTDGATGFNVNNSGLTTVLQPTDITTANARAIDIAGTQISMQFRNVISTDSPAEGIDIDDVPAGSSLSITGVTSVDMAAANGIDIINSQGDFSFANLSLSNIGLNGVNLNNNVGMTSVSFTGGFVRSTTLDGFLVDNTDDVTISGIVFGLPDPVGGDAVDYRSTDGIDRSLTLTNNLSAATTAIAGRGFAISQAGAGIVTARVEGNSIASTGQSFITTDGGMQGRLQLALNGNSWTTASADFASDVVAGGAQSTIVTEFDSNSATGGGMLFSRVTFDGNALGGGVVPVVDSGTTTVSSGSTDGLSLLDPGGDLRLTEVNITTSAGTGLEIFDSGPGDTFNFEIGSLPGTGGSITADGAEAIHLEWTGAGLTGEINLASATSTNSTGLLGAPAANVSGSTGDGLFISQWSGSGPNAASINISQLNVSNAAGNGARITLSQGLMTFGSVTIDEVGASGIVSSSNSTDGTLLTVGGGTIQGTMGDGIRSVNSALTVTGVTFGGTEQVMMMDVADPIGQDAIDIVQTDDRDRTYTITGNTSMLFTDPVTMADNPLINGRAISLLADPAGTGVLTATISGNNLQSVEEALIADVNGNATVDIIVLDISENTLETRLPNPGAVLPPDYLPTVDLRGINVSPTTNSLRVIGFRNNTITGNGISQGVFADAVTFASGSGGAVDGGTMTIGTDGSRIRGIGMRLRDVSGELNFGNPATMTTGALNIATEADMVTGTTGLLVDTKGAGTTFTLTTNGGTIDSMGGPALFLDPLTVNMTLDAVTSTDSTTGPTAASTGDGIHLDGVTGTVDIALLTVTRSDAEGAEILNSNVNMTLTEVALSNIGGDAFAVNMNPGGSLVISGGSIATVTGNAFTIMTGGLFQMDNTSVSAITGFTGDITGTILMGDNNTADMVTQEPTNPGNPGSVIFDTGILD